MMHTLFNGELWVDHSQFYVESQKDSFPAHPREPFAGQRNGLCGAASPGFLCLVTGLHTGEVGLTVESHEEPPRIDEAWEEIVEVSFTPGSDTMVLASGQDAWPLELDQVSLRVRYCGSGMEQGREADTRMEEEPQLDHYLLQFWPGPAEPDRVVKQTSAIAAYWHKTASELPPPPPPPTPEELAEEARRAREAEEAAAERARLAREALMWGGRLPSDRLRQLAGSVVGMVELDRDLSEAIAEADPATQRRIARWAARRACTRAGIAGIDWIAPTLSALDRGQALPSPFDDVERTWRLLWDDERVPHTTVIHYEPGLGEVSQQAVALPALWAAAEDDPLRAALEALFAAVFTFGADYPALLEEVRRTFPAATRRR
jgi:hypothetical protein